MKRSTCGVRAPYIQIDNPPVLSKDGVNKGFLHAAIDAAMGAKLVFFNADGSRDDIPLAVGNELVFFNADGSQDNIAAV